MTMKPLNGELTHALKPASLEALRLIADKPLPRQEVNAGISNRLLRGGLVESVDLPSPYASHKRRCIEHLRVSVAGIARLSEH